MHNIKVRKAMTTRLVDRAKELEKSDNAADIRVARELYVEVVDRETTMIRDLEKAHPALKVLGKALRKAAKQGMLGKA